MTERVRKPLFTAEQPKVPAVPHGEDPSPVLEALYRQAWETSMHDMPFVNRALDIAAIGFRRHEGDWVGAMLTPWFLNLCLLPGGGTLWTDRGSGDRVKVAFPVGELEFIADFDPAGGTPPYQYFPLFQPVSQFATQESAVAAAQAALDALFVPAVAEQSAPAAAEMTPSAPATRVAATAESAPSAPVDVPARRAFFRRVAGQGN